MTSKNSNDPKHSEQTIADQSQTKQFKHIRYKEKENVPAAPETPSKVNRKVSFKVKSSNLKKQDSRMYITISASRVHELTKKFNQMCGTTEGPGLKPTQFPKLNRKFSTIIQTNNSRTSQLITSEIKQLHPSEILKTEIKVKSKPSIKRKPSFVKVKTAKTVIDTIKIFEQGVPLNKPPVDVKKPKIAKSSLPLVKEEITDSKINKKNSQNDTDVTDIKISKSGEKTSFQVVNTIDNESKKMNDQSLEDEKKDLSLKLDCSKVSENTTKAEESKLELDDGADQFPSILNKENTQNSQKLTPENIPSPIMSIAPNTSFLWRSKPPEHYELLAKVSAQDDDISITSDTYQQKYESMLAKTDALIHKFKSQLTHPDEESIHSYDNCSDNYESVDEPEFETYEQVGSVKTEDVQSLYEQIGPERKVQIPSPPLVPPKVDVEALAEAIKRNSVQDGQSNTYESIYLGNKSNRDSIISHDQLSNSLYGRYESKAGSDISYSDKSDDWVDVSDSGPNEDGSSSPAFIIIKAPQKKVEKTWSDKVRCQRKKNAGQFFQDDDYDSDHLYESVSSNEQVSDYEDDVDSFESDTDSEHIISDDQKVGIDTFNQCSELPPTPESNAYSLSKLANRAGKHMQKLKKNWFLTKNDLTKSLGRITRKKTQTDIKHETPTSPTSSFEIVDPFYENTQFSTPSEKSDYSPLQTRNAELRNSPDLNQSHSSNYSKYEKRISVGSHLDSSSVERRAKKKQWSSTVTSKFKRSLSLSGDILTHSRHSLQSDKPKSTFYLCDIQFNDIAEDNKQSPKLIHKINSAESSPISLIKSNSASPISTKSHSKQRSTSSWYTDNDIYQDHQINSEKTSTTSWYAEVGLYPPSESDKSSTAIHSNDSSDSFSSSSPSTIKDDSSENYYNCQKYVQVAEDPNKIIDDMQLIFQDEPLYQFYTAEKVETGMRIMNSWNEDDDSDGYEQIGEHAKKQSRPSAMQLIRPSSPGHSRTLWCEVPQVIASNILSSLTLQQKKVQEAKFEIITSEASYLNSLNVLTTHFIQTIQTEKLLPEEDQAILFANVEPVKKCAENLLADLENCWQNNILLLGICDIIRQHAQDHFSVYVTYCEHQVFIEQVLKQLKDKNEQFLEVLNRLEASSVCQLLPLTSFLMLPMQRITRLPLLLDAILKRLHSDDDEYEACRLALANVNKIVQQCNEGARKVEQQEEFKRTWKTLEFPSTKPICNCDQTQLIKSGEVTQLLSRGDDAKLTFGKRFIKIQLQLFLFTDLLVVAKRKGSDEVFGVIHYCPRSFVEVQSTDTFLPTKDMTGKHLLFVTILENQDGKTIEMLLSCVTATDKQRWYEAFIPPISQNPEETLYESWDCPQVMVLHKYSPQQPDELPLEAGDVVNVTRKMADGWYLGERIRDGRNGWFPGNHVTEVASPHVRAKNLKQRYRLLALSRNFLESQKKNQKNKFL